MQVSTSLISLILFPTIFAFLFKWPKRHGDVIEESRVGLLRRAAAFNIDVFVGICGVGPIISIPPLVVEYFVTGNWQWSFEREFFRQTDLINVFFLLIGMYAIFYYFKWHFKNQKQTVGQHLLNFKLIPSSERQSMEVRALVAWINLAWWPIWPWTIFKRKQDYWWDNSSGIKARRVKPSS